MYTRITGSVGSGKSSYALLKMLRKSYTKKTCYISLEMSPKTINRKINNYLDNKGVDISELKMINVKYLDCTKGIKVICEYIKKMNKKGVNDFVIDAVDLVISIKRSNSYQEAQDDVFNILSQLCLDLNCNITSIHQANRLERDLVGDAIKSSDDDIVNLLPHQDIVLVDSKMAEGKVRFRAYNICTKELEHFSINPFFARSIVS